jgi:hypothetical protein
VRRKLADKPEITLEAFHLMLGLLADNQQKENGYSSTKVEVAKFLLVV